VSRVYTLTFPAKLKPEEDSWGNFVFQVVDSWSKSTGEACERTRPALLGIRRDKLVSKGTSWSAKLHLGAGWAFKGRSASPGEVPR
jgi:hypothetical protein